MTERKLMTAFAVAPHQNCVGNEFGFSNGLHVVVYVEVYANYPLLHWTETLAKGYGYVEAHPEED